MNNAVTWLASKFIKQYFVREFLMGGGGRVKVFFFIYFLLNLT